MTTTFNFYMIQFLLYKFKDEYAASMMSAVSNIVGFVFAGLLFNRLGTKAMFVLANGLATVGGIIILIYGLNHEEGWIFPMLVFISKLGVACSLNTIFIAHNTIFPVLFSATSFGIVNVLSRIACALSPLFSLFKEPVPMLAFTFSSGITCILSFCLQIESRKEDISNR